MRCGLVLLVSAAIAAPGSAHAGRSFYGWLHGSEVMPERGVELQMWVSEENRVEDEANRSESLWGIGPFIGITDQLELALPLDVLWFATPGVNAGTALYDYGAELRYRMVSQDPEEAPPFAPLVLFPRFPPFAPFATFTPFAAFAAFAAIGRSVQYSRGRQPFNGGPIAMLNACPGGSDRTPSIRVAGSLTDPKSR